MKPTTVDRGSKKVPTRLLERMGCRGGGKERKEECLRKNGSSLPFSKQSYGLSVIFARGFEYQTTILPNS